MKYIAQLVESVKQKPELSNVDSAFIADQIQNYIPKHKKILTKLESSTSFAKFQLSKEYKQVLKAIRANVRKSYALFQLDPKQRTKLFTQLKKNPKSLTSHKQLLETHRSSKERLAIYPKLYKDLFQITGEPESILDLGCGLNPLSFPWMNLKDTKYITVELNKEDLKLIKDYFNLKKINGLTLPLNLIKEYHKLKEFNVDVCFMFKLLDSLEITQKNISEKLIQSINSKYIVASFSTKSVGGKQMRSSRRKWFEFLAKKLDFEYRTLKYENEIFYVLSKTGFD